MSASLPSSEEPDPKTVARFPAHPGGGESREGSPFEPPPGAPWRRPDLGNARALHLIDPRSYEAPYDSEEEFRK